MTLAGRRARAGSHTHSYATQRHLLTLHSENTQQHTHKAIRTHHRYTLNIIHMHQWYTLNINTHAPVIHTPLIRQSEANWEQWRKRATQAVCVIFYSRLQSSKWWRVCFLFFTPRAQLSSLLTTTTTQRQTHNSVITIMITKLTDVKKITSLQTFNNFCLNSIKGSRCSNHCRTVWPRATHNSNTQPLTAVIVTVKLSPH